MNNMTQKDALKELLKRIKKYWYMLLLSVVFATAYVILVFVYSKTNRTWNRQNYWSGKS